MKIHPNLPRALGAFLCAAVLLVSTAHAQLAYRVSVDTSVLGGHPAAPFYLDFQLNDGSGVGDGNNTATLTNFNFGSGWATGAGSSFGDVSGDLYSSVTLTDSTPFNEFYQSFAPGGLLTFDLHLTTNLNEGLVPDLFSFAILDSDLANLPTWSGGSDALLVVNIDSLAPMIEAYAGDGTLAPSAGGDPIGLAAPTFTPVPEPSTYGAMAALVLVGAVWLRRRNARQVAVAIAS